jgi:predicted N-acetyltransferase YhbS
VGAIRPLRAADAPDVAALVRLAFGAQSAATDPPSAALRETAATIAAAIAEGGGAGFDTSGQLVAVVLWTEKEGGLYFGRLAVRPDWRRRGLARALIAAAEAEARRRHLVRVHLSTRLPLLDNRRLFAACGYREVELRAHAGYAAPTSVVMEKFLA